MLYFFRFLSGYLRVFFYPESEKILNLTAKNNITLWDTKLKKNGIEGCISVSDFRKLAYLKRPKGSRAHILRRYGLPFKLKSNRRKLRTALCLTVFFAVLFLVSQFIWSIEIVGNHKTDTEEILLALKEIGIYEGVKNSDISPKIDRERLLLNLDTISWCSLNIEGSHLTVNVSEITEKEAKSVPTNLVAEFDGTIKKINVITGNCVVKVGDTVAKGDILVSGINENSKSTKFVVSKGEIIAETVSEFTVSDTFSQTYTEPSGNTKTKKVLEFFTLKIPLYLGCETDTFKSETTIKTATLFGAKLPIKIYKKDFIFTNTYEKTLTEAELLKNLSNRLENILKEKRITNYEIIETETKRTANSLTLKALVKGQINIALPKEIQLSP